MIIYREFTTNSYYNTATKPNLQLSEGETGRAVLAGVRSVAAVSLVPLHLPRGDTLTTPRVRTGGATVLTLGAVFLRRREEGGREEGGRGRGVVSLLPVECWRQCRYCVLLLCG